MPEHRRDADRQGAFLAALNPAGLKAVFVTVEQLESDHDAALAQWRLAVERAHYEAKQAQRRYRAVAPENRLVARGLEKNEWEMYLRELSNAEAELARREQQRPRTLTPDEREHIENLGADLGKVWYAPTTTDRDRKELLRTLLEVVIIAVKHKEANAHLTLRWKGGLITELDLHLPQIPCFKPPAATAGRIGHHPGGGEHP